MRVQALSFEQKVSVVFITFINILNEQRLLVIINQYTETFNPRSYPTLGSCSSPNQVKRLTLECLRPPICSDSHLSQDWSPR